ncbi:MAG: hypothetical protein RLZZ77_1358 [Bacteroidota bacterium]|jgi:Domain of unknown function (DUF4296)
MNLKRDNVLRSIDKNMRRILIVGMVWLFAASCGDDGSPQQPLMDQESFTQLLLEVRLVEGMYSIHYRNIDQQEGQLADYFKVVFVKYGVTREQFEQSYKAYSADGNAILEIEKEVGERLSKMQAENQQQILKDK